MQSEGIPIPVLDLVIIALYFLVVFGIGYYVAKRTKSGEDMFLAGRSLTWGVIGFSLFASNISSTTLIGLSGSAYSEGIAISNYEWMAGIVLVFMAFYIIPFFINSRISTVPEFLEKRFDVRSRRYFSGVTIITSLIVDTAGGLYAGALVLQTFYPDLNFTLTCVVIAVIAGVYTAAGGLKAVVFTDVLQAVVLIIGTAIMAGVIFAQFGFSWEQATAAIPDSNLSLIGDHPIGDPQLPWLGTLIGVPILGLYYWSFNQYIVQRILGAQNLKHARWGAVLGGTLKLLPLFIMVLPGAFALTLFPNLENPDQVFPMMVTELLPVGLTGLVLAGLVAAIMSSIDSTLNSASTLLTIDFVEPLRGGMSEQAKRRFGIISTLAFMIFAAFYAPLIQNFSGLFAYLQQILSYIVPPVVAVFILGIFWKRANAQGCFWTLILGHVMTISVFLVTILTDLITLHFTIVAGILTALSFLICVVVSLTLGEAPAKEKTRDLTYEGHFSDPSEKDLAWYKDYRWQSAVMLALTAVCIVLFW